MPTARIARHAAPYAVCFVALALLSACATDVPLGQLPQTGISGMDGGSTLTIYYDDQGNPHFHT